MTHDMGAWLAAELAARGLEAEPMAAHAPADMPCLHVNRDHWARAAELVRELGLRLVAVWAADEHPFGFAGFAVYMALAHKDHGYALLRTEFEGESPKFPSIASHYVAAARMERTIHDLFALVPVGHPDPRPWIAHEHWPEKAHPLRKDFAGRLGHSDGSYPFIAAEGEGVYEIPVGPVHAGIIEPGHFRFLAVGEQILNLEERLGYVHKGIEKAMERRPVAEAARLAARISGDCSVAHAWAFAQACEYAAGMDVPERSLHLRAIACERERMANHIGDIGAVCNDAAFTFMHMQMQRLREDMARLNKDVFGHRLLMDFVLPGGVARDLDEDSLKRLAAQTAAIAAEVEELRATYADHAAIQERVIGSGVVGCEDAADIGLLGYVGHASGVYVDARVDEAYAPYDRLKLRVPQGKLGDVATRVWARFEEIAEAARIIDDLATGLPRGAVHAPFAPPQQGTSGFAVIESWRGEIAAWVRFGASGVIDRYFVRDPSVINWLGLELAVRDVPVPDFPLNNKSFNCSYAGNDL